MSKPEIIYRDEYLVVVNKPVDLPVHKNSHMPNDAPYLTKWAGQYFDCSVYNVHRLDAKTSGIVLLAFSSEIAGKLTQQFERGLVNKKYLALVREFPGEKGLLDKPVMNKRKGRLVPAKTVFKTVRTIQTDITYKEFENIRISEVELRPHTGKWHQLRQHMALERNDIVGDNQHGDRTMNHIIEERTGIKRLMLHAQSLAFTHPITEQEMLVESNMPDEFEELIAKL
ncbi:MAG: hypothetical protein C0599_01725 [Salinivirgaceae bacterium]|nr:MAG: hypothetical protein C0599_01725 [Salinivirgaceae bacterium]